VAGAVRRAEIAVRVRADGGVTLETRSRRGAMKILLAIDDSECSAAAAKIA
jgi:hypothetical protein